MTSKVNPQALDQGFALDRGIITPPDSRAECTSECIDRSAAQILEAHRPGQGLRAYAASATGADCTCGAAALPLDLEDPPIPPSTDRRN